MFCPFLMSTPAFWPAPGVIVVVPIRSWKKVVSLKTTAWRNWGSTLICRAIVKKACSTFVAFLAKVSRKEMPRPSANSWRQIMYSEEIPLQQCI